MPYYEVETPDGKIMQIEGPEGVPESQVMAYATSIYRQQLAQKQPEPVEEKPKERTWGEAATDIGASLTSGIGALAQMPGQIGTLAGFYKPEEADTGLQGIGRALEKTGQEMKSEQLKAKEAARAQKVGQAQGVVDEFWTAIKETATDPALMTSFFAEQVPNLIGSMGAGLLTRGAVKLAMREATEAALQRSAVAGMVGSGAVMQGADVGADTFENLYSKLVQDGTPPEKAAEIALDKGRLASIEAAAISVGTAFLPGGTTLERALVGRGLPRTGGIVKGFAGEAAQEGLEEGGGKLVSNIQEQALYPETDIFKGVGEAAGMGALMGGAFGGIGGVSLRAPARPAVPPEVATTEAATEQVAPEAVSPEAAPAATPISEAAREAEAIREMEREGETRFEAPPVEQPVVEPTPAAEQPVAEPSAVAEPAAVEPTVAPEAAAPETAPSQEVVTTTFDPAPFVERNRIDGVPALTPTLRNEIGREIQSQLDAGNTVVATYNGQPVKISEVQNGNLIGENGESLSPFWFLGVQGQEQNQIKIQSPATPVESKPIPETLHPLEARNVPGQQAAYQEATQKAKAAGIEPVIQNGRINPELTTVDWNEVSKFKNLGGLLNHIQPHVPVDYAEIIKKILPSVKNIPLNVVNRVGGSPRALGAYKPAIVKATGDVVRHSIELSTANNGNDISTILHEALHGATVSNYYRGKKGNETYAQAAKDLDSLTRKLFALVKEGKADLPFMRDYKRANLARELISWGQTDRQVQAELKKIVLPNKKTAWSEFVNTMRKLLGLPANQTTALERLLDISERLTSQQDVLARKPTAQAVEEVDVLAKEKPEGYPSPRATALGGNLTTPPWSIEPLSDKTVWQRFLDNKVYEYVNKFVDLDQIIKAINQSAKKLDDQWNASLRENLYHKRVDHQTAEFEEKELKPLAQEMVARGVSEEELNNYLLARHAEAYNREINERNDRPDLYNRGSGVYSEIANAYMRGASAQEVAALCEAMKSNGIEINKNEEALLSDLAKMSESKRKALQSLAKRVDAIIKKTQDTAVEGGIETAATVDYWRSKYPDYVPLRRDPDELDFVETSTGMGKGFSARAGFGKAATGSLKSVDNILMNIMLQRDIAITKAEKARIGRALFGMALSHPNPSFWLPVNPNAAILGKARDLGFKIAKLRTQLDAINATIEARRQRGELVSGEDLKRAQDLSENIAQESARYDEMERQGEAVKKQMIDELVGMGLDPAMIDNLIREPQGAFYNPNTGKVEYRTNNFLRASPNVLAIPVNGETRYIFFNPGDERAKRLVTSLRGADVEQIGQITALMGKFTRWISLVNTQYNPFFGIVNMIRDVQGAQFNLSSTPLAGQQMAVNKKILSAASSIYRTLRSGEPSGELGKDWIELQERGGTTGAKDMIVDQQKKISFLQKEIEDLQRNPTDAALRKSARAVFNWMSDFNDTMENAVRLAAFVEAKKKFNKIHPGNPNLAADKAAALAKNLTVNFNRKGAKTKFVNSWYAFFNAAVQGSARMFETLKGPAGKKIIGSLVLLGVIQQIILSAAGFEDDDPPEFVREKNLVIPTGGGKYLSWPMPLGFNFFVNLGRISSAAVESGGKNAAKDIANLLNVAADTFSPVGGGTLSQAVTPTPFDPYFAVRENVDQFGRPIYREDRPGQPSPGYLRSTEGATLPSKTIAEILNRISGGTEFQKGKISPTADEIDYYAGQIGGGTYREARKVVEFAKNVATGEETAPYRVPLAGRFMGDTGSEANVRNKFYENVQRLAGYEQEIKGRAKKGQDVGDFLEKNPDARLYQTADSVYNEVSKINKMRKQLVERGASKDQLKQLNDYKIQLMRQFNTAIDQTKPK